MGWQIILLSMLNNRTLSTEIQAWTHRIMQFPLPWSQAIWGFSSRNNAGDRGEGGGKAVAAQRRVRPTGALRGGGRRPRRWMVRSEAGARKKMAMEEVGSDGVLPGRRAEWGEWVEATEKTHEETNHPQA